MLTRPTRWSRDKNIFITERKYDMEILHRYIKRCIKGTSADVKHVKVMNGLLDEGYYGICIFDRKEIWVDSLECGVTFYVTLLHEIFHYYFRDYDDNRENIPKEDFVEFRVEKSATNMLKWYIVIETLKNVKQIEVQNLSQEEKDEL